MLAALAACLLLCVSHALTCVGARSMLGAGDRCEGDWGYQWCTEMVQPFSNDGLNDMFWPPSPFNLSAGPCCRLLVHGRACASAPCRVLYAALCRVFQLVALDITTQRSMVRVPEV